MWPLIGAGARDHAEAIALHRAESCRATSIGRRRRRSTSCLDLARSAPGAGFDVSSRSTSHATSARSVLLRRELLDDRVGAVVAVDAQAEPLRELADDLDALDRVDAEVGLEIEIDAERLDRIAGALADDRDHELHRIDAAPARRAGVAATGAGSGSRRRSTASRRRDVDHASIARPSAPAPCRGTTA